MRKDTFSTVFTGKTSDEAAGICRELRSIGLHPADLGLTVPLPTPGISATFPVEVPCAESDQARHFLGSKNPAQSGAAT